MVVKFSQEVQHRFYPLGLWISVWNEIYHYCTTAWRGLKGRSSACMYKKNGADTICVSVFKPWCRWFSQWFCSLSNAILVVYNCVGGHLSTSSSFYLFFFLHLLSHPVFCVGWWHEWFHTHKGVISADDYRKWFKCMDLTGRITRKMFWPVHILTHCLDIVAHIGFRQYFFWSQFTIFSTQKDLTWSCPSKFFWHVLYFFLLEVDQETGIYWKWLSYL